MKSKDRSGVVRLVRSWRRKDVGWWWQQQAHFTTRPTVKGDDSLSSSASATKNWPFPLVQEEATRKRRNPCVFVFGVCGGSGACVWFSRGVFVMCMMKLLMTKLAWVASKKRHQNPFWKRHSWLPASVGRQVVLLPSVRGRAALPGCKRESVQASKASRRRAGLWVDSCLFVCRLWSPPYPHHHQHHHHHHHDRHLQTKVVVVHLCRWAGCSGGMVVAAALLSMLGKKEARQAVLTKPEKTRENPRRTRFCVPWTLLFSFCVV